VSACNYNADAGCDGVSCNYGSVPGCTDEFTCNYNPDADCDDGSCFASQCWLAPEIVPNSGPVEIEMFAYCYDIDFPQPQPEGSSSTWFAINPNGENMLFTVTAGTTDPLSLSLYIGCHPSLQLNCGSWPNCFYEYYLDEFDYLINYNSLYWSCPETGLGIPYYLCVKAEGSGTVFLDFVTVGEYGCMDENYCNYNPQAVCDAENCEGLPGCNSPSACNYDPATSCDDGSCVPSGCMDATAFNFNPLAGCDDASCQFHGCTYPSADNYDSAANVDDGQCIFPPSSCPADFNGDNEVNTADLLTFLSLFGGVCDP
jgi:hypothetical protein